VGAEVRELVSERDVRACHRRCFSLKSAQVIEKNKEIAKLHGPSVRKRIEGKDLARFLGGGQENGGMPEGLQVASH
jgi:hypothetical protein